MKPAMMKRAVMLLFALSALFLLPGCRDRINLEDITLVLMLGVDLDKDNNLVVYSSSPVFSKEAKDKNEVTQVNSLTLRDARGGFESRVSALFATGKLQNILIGKKVIEQPGWTRLLDLFYRDSKTRINARLVVVDGSVADVMYFAPPNKRRMSLHIAKLMDTAHKRNLIEETSLWEFHRQMFERGRTPDMAQLRKTKREVVVDRSALLDHEGLYVTSINLLETELLQIVQDDKKADLSLTVFLPEEAKGNKSVFKLDGISFYVLDVDRKVKTAFKDGKMHFDLDIGLPIRLTERLFAFDMKNIKELQNQIDKQLLTEMDALVAKLQKNKVDPIGLGLYARAYQYQAWKKVQNDWGNAFSKAEVKLHVHTRIVDMGEVR
ncbi:Ger(x)C family spore germination protein [Paenibacillus rhizovicinus]|uniref:Ger(X)C family spore germination protein n=1 Tax=Paenibacillus rhizovicinus TaxID=2704463 RepID=A0A6C0P7V7_9BACL|nr:Ger(x)C family spore germination protein [Paenibacillus rhizovicinus]QHW34667.1 Ger(x)C family spore germination protein [Paenibacillus rhizovicinus]